MSNQDKADKFREIADAADNLSSIGEQLNG